MQELGGSVRKGEKASQIVFWKRWEKTEEQGEEEVKKTIPILRYFTVFNAEQTDGLGLPMPYTPPEREHERIERAEILVREMPGPPRIQEGGRAAWYSPKQDLVQVPKIEHFTSADTYYCTLFHELSHASGHESRLNRKGVMEQIQFGSEVYSQEELVAELSSAFLCATCGLDNSLIGDSASYIGGWLQVLKNDPKAMVIAATQAQRAADYIKGVTYAS